MNHNTHEKIKEENNEHENGNPFLKTINYIGTTLHLHAIENSNLSAMKPLYIHSFYRGEKGAERKKNTESCKIFFLDRIICSRSTQIESENKNPLTFP